MASDQDDTVYPDECHDLDDDDEESESYDDLEENEDVLAPEENDEEEDEVEEEEDLNSPSMSSPTLVPTTTTIATAVTVAVPAASAVTVAAISNGTDPPLTTLPHRVVDTALIVQEDKHKPPPPQLDDSRRLFQRLWTDEDEIELLQGFFDYTTSNRTGNSHHTDTAVFYDQIKSKLQLDFNKNQLVEKLRRLKKKYRNVMSKINSGKEFSFKSPHDQATFEISRKIWNNTGKIIGVEDNVLDDEETNNNINCNYSISNVNLNPSPNFEVKVEDGVEKKAASRSRKRPRSKSGKIEETRVLGEGLVMNNENVGIGGGGGGSGGNMVGVIEETVRSCLSPVFKEMLSGTMMMMGGMPCGGRGMGMGMGMGMGLTACNPMMPLSFGGMVGFGAGGSGGEVVDERWRKQQILELEVYSKRLELVQDQIKATLEELRSMGGG